MKNLIEQYVLSIFLVLRFNSDDVRKIYINIVCLHYVHISEQNRVIAQKLAFLAFYPQHLNSNNQFFSYP